MRLSHIRSWGTRVGDSSELKPKVLISVLLYDSLECGRIYMVQLDAISVELPEPAWKGC